MEYADGKVKDLQIAYIGGGSRGWAWTFMTDLAMDEELSGTIRLYDIDAEAAKHNEIIGNRLSAFSRLTVRRVRGTASSTSSGVMSRKPSSSSVSSSSISSSSSVI